MTAPFFKKGALQNAIHSVRVLSAHAEIHFAAPLFTSDQRFRPVLLFDIMEDERLHIRPVLAHHKGEFAVKRILRHLQIPFVFLWYSVLIIATH